MRLYRIKLSTHDMDIYKEDGLFPRECASEFLEENTYEIIRPTLQEFKRYKNESQLEMFATYMLRIVCNNNISVQIYNYIDGFENIRFPGSFKEFLFKRDEEPHIVTIKKLFSADDNRLERMEYLASIR